ncbi:MAG: sulfatase [Bacteroidota bacterium]
MIHVDDLGWADLSSQGSTFYETPNIDGLGASGIRFTQGYAAAAICSPTRAALMMAQHPARIGITDWIRASFQQDGDPVPDEDGFVRLSDMPLATPFTPYELSSEEKTIAERLRDAGYRTIHIGKWHLGGDGYGPEDQGFDVNVGGTDLGEPPSFFDPYSNERVNGIETLPPRSEGEYLTDRETDEAVRLIRESSDNPFFMHLAPYAVHTPIQAPEATVEYYESRFSSPTQSNATYAAMIDHVDRMVGRVIQALEEEGLRERTLVVFTSDNGGQSDERGITSNAPLRSGKGYPWEGGIRVPMMVSWPGEIPAATISHIPVHTVDLAATFLDFGGATPGPDTPVDGVSLREYILSGDSIGLMDRSIVWHFPHYRQGRRVTPHSVIRSGPWKLLKWFEGPRYELYHLIDDPEESANLASEYPDRVDTMDRELMEELDAMGARMPREVE